MTDKLKILPVRKLKDPSRKKVKINPLLPQPPFLWCLSAGVASGKTNFLVNVCRNPYFGYDKAFSTIFWISPTIENDATAWAIREDENIITISDDLEDVGDILDSIVEQQKEDEEQGQKEDVLIILDDMLGYLRNKTRLN